MNYAGFRMVRQGDVCFTREIHAKWVKFTQLFDWPATLWSQTWQEQTETDKIESSVISDSFYWIQGHCPDGYTPSPPLEP